MNTATLLAEDIVPADSTISTETAVDENKSATVTKVDGEKAEVTNSGSKESSEEPTSNSDTLGKDATDGEDSVEKTPKKPWFFHPSSDPDNKGVNENALENNGASVLAKVAGLPAALKATVTAPFAFHKNMDNKSIKSLHDKIGCPYKDHPVLFGAIIGAIVGVATYKFVNNRINKQVLKKLSEEDKNNIATAGLISQRDSLQKEIVDIEIAVDGRGFATIEEEEELVRLEIKLAQTEGYIIAVVRANKPVAKLIKDFFSNFEA